MVHGTPVQRIVSAAAGVFVLGNLIAAALLAFTPLRPNPRGSLLLAIFILTLLASLVCLVFLLRWVLRPYRQLIGEAEKAPVTALPGHARNEAEFVLETFQSVVARLQAQQKELEALTVQASARADSAERFSDRIIASVPSGLIAFDSEGLSTIINSTGRTLIEADGDPVGQPVRKLLRNTPDLARMVEECLETGHLYRREEIEAEVSGDRKRKLGTTVAPIDQPGESGGRGALCLLTDITEITKLREQLALKRNLESLGEMSAGLAHEFKNSLATLHGYAQLMLNLNADERGRAAAESLLHEVRSLSEMVTAFLNFARPQPLELSEVSLREIIEDCENELKPLYLSRRVEFSVEGEFTNLNADKRMLRQAFLNIFRNAAEAIGSESADRSVRVRAEPAGKDWVAIEVIDSGSGIPVSDLEKIFIPFFTSKSTGNGIGLALAHRVITDHGGMLSGGNTTTGGAIFTIKLPRTAREPGERL